MLLLLLLFSLVLSILASHQPPTSTLTSQRRPTDLQTDRFVEPELCEHPKNSPPKTLRAATLSRSLTVYLSVCLPAMRAIKECKLICSGRRQLIPPHQHNMCVYVGFLLACDVSMAQA